MFGSRPLLAPIQLKELSVPKVRSPIGKVLTQEWYQKRPIALQDAIGRSGGVKKAADIIEQVVLTRKRVFAEKKPQTVVGFCVLTETTAPKQTISKAVARIFNCLSIILKQSIFSHFRKV